MVMKGTSKNDMKIVEEAKKFNDSWVSYYAENNRKYKYDTKFAYAEDGMWDNDMKDEYDLLEKPMFSFNLIIKHLNSICDQYSKNTPQPKVRAKLDTPTDPKKIKLVEGMLNKIDEESRGDIVKKTSLACALAGGYGARRLLVVPESTYNFNLEIKYSAIIDPLMCCWDVKATYPDKGDGDGCLQKKPITVSAFKKMYPNQKLPENFDNEEGSTTGALSFTEKYVWIADFYRKECFKIKIHQLSDGSVFNGNDEELQEHLDQNNFGTGSSEKIEVLKSETRQDYKIMYYKLTGDRILERAKWDGKKLPIIFQPGILKYVDGKEVTISFIRYVKDDQRLYNWARSENAYRIALERYERVAIAEEAVEGHEEQWQNQHKAKGAMVFKSGPEIPLPIPMPRSPKDPSLLQEIETSRRDIQEITGRYDAATGALSNEVSRVGADGSRMASNSSTGDFFDNARLTDESMYLAALELMPKVYDTTRRVTLTENDGSAKEVMLNDSNGTENKLDGDYDVSVKAGPSFEVQQRESVAFLLEWKRTSPNLGKILDPVIADNLNIRGAEIVKEGIKNMESQPPAPNPELQMQQQELLLEKQRTAIAHFESLTNRMKVISSSWKDKADGTASLTNAQVNAEKAKIQGGQAAHKMAIDEEKAQQEGFRTSVEMFKATEEK